MSLLFAVSCSGKKQGGLNKNVVNNSYLKSESYQSFKKKALKENERSFRQEQAFSKFLGKALVQKPGKLLDSPLIINQSFIEKAFREDRNENPLLTTAFGLKQLYHPLAQVKTLNADVHFFAMCKITSYDKCLVWMATSRDQKVVEAQMIATYNRALAYHEMPVIRFEPPQVHVKIKRSVQYPMTMLRSYTLSYKVMPGGRIYRID